LWGVGGIGVHEVCAKCVGCMCVCWNSGMCGVGCRVWDVGCGVWSVGCERRGVGCGVVRRGVW